MDKVQYINGNDYRKIFIVGDLHGNYDKFLMQLSDLGFSIKTDLCICCGDLIDRGDQNAECIDLIHQQWFYSVQGNHEQLLYESRWHDPQDFNAHTARSIHRSNGGEWIYLHSAGELEAYGEFVNQLPYIIDLTTNAGERIGVLHAGIPIFHQKEPHWDDFINHVAELADDITLNTILWDNRVLSMLRKNPETIPKITGVDKIFLGHSPHPARDGRTYGNGQITCIDSGTCFYDTPFNIIQVQ